MVMTILLLGALLLGALLLGALLLGALLRECTLLVSKIYFGVTIFCFKMSRFPVRL